MLLSLKSIYINSLFKGNILFIFISSDFKKDKPEYALIIRFAFSRLGGSTRLFSPSLFFQLSLPRVQRFFSFFRLFLPFFQRFYSLVQPFSLLTTLASQGSALLLLFSALPSLLSAVLLACSALLSSFSSRFPGFSTSSPFFGSSFPSFSGSTRLFSSSPSTH